MNPRHDELIRNTYTSDIGFVGSPLAKLIVFMVCLGSIGSIFWFWSDIRLTIFATISVSIIAGVVFLATKQTPNNKHILKLSFYVFLLMLIANQIVQIWRI